MHPRVPDAVQAWVQSLQRLGSAGDRPGDFKLVDTPTCRLSQAHLNLFEACPRKFQHLYLDQLAVPASPLQQERARWGNQFHLLMQQRELALPLAPLLDTEPQLESTFQALEQVAPELFIPQPSAQRDAEHSRSLSQQGFLLTAVYDLLITTPEQAQIIDWKTYLRPRARAELARDWQTRLYLFLLAATSDYAPEQIRLTYWFVQVSPQPQALTFTYSRQQHEQTSQALEALLTDLEAALSCYHHGELLPQVEPQAGLCPSCPFSRRCDRLASAATLPPEWPAAIATIPERIP